MLVARIRSSMSFEEYFLNSNSLDKLKGWHAPEKEKKEDGRNPEKENESLTKFHSYNLKKSLQFSVYNVYMLFV